MAVVKIEFKMDTSIYYRAGDTMWIEEKEISEKKITGLVKVLSENKTKEANK